MNAVHHVDVNDPAVMATMLATTPTRCGVHGTTIMDRRCVDCDTTPTPVKPGDIFRCSWGYDQTNVDWYQVVKLSKSGAYVTLVPIGSRCVEDNGPTTHEVPVPTSSPDLTRAFRRKLLNYRTDWHVNIASYSSASLWDGTPAYETGAGWGH